MRGLFDPIPEYTPRNNPYQIAVWAREGQVCGINAFFNMPEPVVQERKAQGFLEPTKLAYLRFTILNTKGNNKQAVHANIPMHAIPGIVAMMEQVMLADRIRALVQPKQQNASMLAQGAVSIAYTQKLSLSPFAGMTPAQVLVNTPDKAMDLYNMYNRLMENAQKYRTNVAQAQAISEALSLYNNSALDPSLAAANVSTDQSETRIEIYGAEPATISDKRYKDASGRNLCYGIHVTYNPQMRYKWQLHICNYYAPITRAANGTQNVLVKERSDFREDKMTISDSEFMNVMYHIQSMYNAFLNATFATRYNMAKADADCQYQAAKTAAS